MTLSLRYLTLSAWLLTGLAWGQDAKALKDAFIDAKSAGPDFAVQGEYVGEVTGQGKYGAQVVALGESKFDVYFLKGGLPGAGWDAETRVKAEAKTAEGKTALLAKEKSWQGEFSSDSLTGKSPEGQAFTLKKIVRESSTMGAKPPEKAVLLFQGKTADEWSNGKIVEENLLYCGTSSKQKLAGGTLHIEFRTPFQPKARGQGRGNSGVYVLGREVQVLDSFGLKGENNECGGLYGNAKPKVNMCFPPLSWQTYDIELKPTGDANAFLLTVKHNGVVVHENVPVKGGASAINLQNHGNYVVYRNIWFLPSP